MHKIWWGIVVILTEICGGGTDCHGAALAGRTESSAPTKQNKNRAKRDVVPQGHLFRCAPLQDAVPYTRFNTPSCRVEPVCPAEKCVPGGGTHGSRPTGAYPPKKTTRRPLRDAVPYGRDDVGIVPYRAAAGCPLQVQVAGHADHGAAADADGHGAVLFIQDAAYL